MRGDTQHITSQRKIQSSSTVPIEYVSLLHHHKEKKKVSLSNIPSWRPSVLVSIKSCKKKKKKRLKNKIQFIKEYCTHRYGTSFYQEFQHHSNTKLCFNFMYKRCAERCMPQQFLCY